MGTDMTSLTRYYTLQAAAQTWNLDSFTEAQLLRLLESRRIVADHMHDSLHLCGRVARVGYDTACQQIDEIELELSRRQ